MSAYRLSLLNNGGFAGRDLMRFRVVYRLPLTDTQVVEFVHAESMQAAIVKVALAHENIEVLSAGLP